MAVQNLFHLRALKIANPGSTAAFNITHMENLNTDRNFRQISQSSAGDFAPCSQGLSGTDPSISFDSTQLLDLFNMFSQSTSSQQSLITDLSAGNVSLIYAAGKPNAIREADTASEHIIGTLANNAAIYWNSLSVSQDEKASVSVVVKTSGTAPGNDALSFSVVPLTGANAAPTACHEIFTLGPVYYGGIQIEGVTSVSWQNNVNEINFRSDGSKSTSYFGVQDFAPQVTVTTSDGDELTVGGIGGSGHAGLTTGLLVVYLKKFSKTNFFVSNATTEHIRLVANAGLKMVPSISGNPAEFAMQFMLEKDSGGNVFTAETGVAIP